jgi:hypothetical protein
MRSNFEEARAEESRQLRLAAQTEALKGWLEKNHPEISFGIALLKEFRENMLGAFFTADDADWQYALNMIDTRYLRQHVNTPDETKAELTDKICELLRNPNGGTSGGKYSDLDLSAFRKNKAPFMSISELTAKLEQIVRSQTIAKQPMSETKQILVSARKYQGYPTLGKTVVPPGQVHAIQQDAAYLKSLDSWELKRLCRLYGVEQVNNRLAGKD